MPKWLKKILVSVITVITLGTVVPTLNSVPRENPKGPTHDVQGQNKPNGTNESHHEAVLESNESRKKRKDNWSTLVAETKDPDKLLTLLSEFAAEQATQQGLKKFGQTIEDRIGETYSKTIVPKFGEAVAHFGKDADFETLMNLAVSDNPAPGNGERILHFYDERTGKELIKFHVRRDHPPLEGYWFNFHYHTAKDNFQSHHEIGKIYWDKNMPPRWMA
jgi:hypothetical protein